jgi:thiol:disulfide interchange protein DsbC
MLKKNTIAVAVMTIFAVAAHAGTVDVEKQLREKYPATKVTAVNTTPIGGIYEVVMGRNVAYTDESGRYMIFGHMYDMQQQQDLTAQRLDDLNKIDVSMLPLADAIKTVKGDGSRKLYVFSDPDCPYCKKLEAELAKLDNVTIYTFLYPLTELHPDAKRKADLIWCAKDKVKAWEVFMKDNKLPEGETKCQTPVDSNIRLGASLGINGTPTIIFHGGKMAPGMLPATEIERRLAGGGNSSAGAALRQ